MSGRPPWILASVLCGMALAGCAAQTNPSGEALKVMLANEGNPTTWVFHASAEHVAEAVQKASAYVSCWEISGDAAHGLAEDALAPHKYSSSRVDGYEGEEHTVELWVKLLRTPEGTQVGVEARGSSVSYPMFRLPNCPCCWPFGFGGAHGIQDLKGWKSVPSNTVAEYSMLLEIGRFLGEQGMPSLKTPKIKVLP